MGENKRLLNIHEQKFAEIAAFQENTTVFQANTNDSLKNLEVQIGQLAITMQNLEALTQMSLYVKFMKEILSRKRKILEEGIVSMTVTYSAVIQNSILEKM